MYVLQVKSGKEEIVRNALNSAGYHALVPVENRMIRSGGNWTQKEYVLFPNYVFIETEYNAENFYRITSMNHVTRFLGNKFDPSQLTFIEVEWIRLLSNGGTPLHPTLVKFDESNEPTILKGVLESFKSRVKAFNKRQRKATFEITICNEIKEITLSIDILEDNTDHEASED